MKLKNHVIYPYASYRCTSVFMKNKTWKSLQHLAIAMEKKNVLMFMFMFIFMFINQILSHIILTDNSDESRCQNNPATTLVLIISMLMVLLFFWVLRFLIGALPVSHSQKWKKRSETVPLSIENLLLKYEDNLNDSDIVREANLFLHH